MQYFIIQRKNRKKEEDSYIRNINQRQFLEALENWKIDAWLHVIEENNILEYYTEQLNRDHGLHNVILYCFKKLKDFGKLNNG